MDSRSAKIDGKFRSISKDRDDVADNMGNSVVGSAGVQAYVGKTHELAREGNSPPLNLPTGNASLDKGMPPVSSETGTDTSTSTKKESVRLPSITFRMEQELVDTINAGSKETKKSKSQYVRDLLLVALDDVKAAKLVPSKPIYLYNKGILYILTNIATNLNQVARAYNAIWLKLPDGCDSLSLPSEIYELLYNIDSYTRALADYMKENAITELKSKKGHV